MEMCSIYGLPNQTYIHCTRELKLQPIAKWGKEATLLLKLWNKTGFSLFLIFQKELINGRKSVFHYSNDLL